MIADLHFGHRKVQEIRGISDDELVQRWNSVVTKRDVVYVLGDVFKLHRVPELKGIKKFALGNHDQYPIARYLEHFTQVRGMFQLDGCILTHIPVHPGQFYRYRLNVHGHTHAHTLSDPRYICVSVEQLDFKPVLLNSLLLPQKGDIQ